MSNLIKYQFVDLHPFDTVKINNNDKKDNFIPLGKDGGISIETIGQQEAEKAILSLQKKENNEAEPENISEEEYEKTKEEAEFLIEEAKNRPEQMRSEASRQIQEEMKRAVEDRPEPGISGRLAASGTGNRPCGKKNSMIRRETRNVS